MPEKSEPMRETVGTRLLVLVLVMLALTATAAAAAPQQNAPHPQLDAIATAVAGRPVSVWCETSYADWDQAMQVIGYHGYEIGGVTWIGRPSVYIAPTACATLHAALRADTSAGEYWLSMAILTLVHEAVHQRGIPNEALTECLSMKELRGVVTRFLPGYGETIVVPQVQTFTRTVVRRVRGKRVTIRVTSERVVQVEQPNPRLANLLAWAEAWHRAAPTQYQGATC